MMTILGNRYKASEFKSGWVVRLPDYKAGTPSAPHGTSITRQLKICTVDIKRIDRIWFTVEDCSTGNFEVRSLGTISLYERIEK